MVCSKLNNEKSTWTAVDNLKLAKGQFISFLNLPNGNILFLIKSKAIYMYDGEKIQKISGEFPFPDKDFSNPFCRTAISNHEILVGFAPENVTENGNLSTPVELYSIDLNKMGRNAVSITVPDFDLMNSLCGAFGPEGNRKVAIFGGHQIIMGKPGPVFERTLILDWNLQTFDMNGPSLGVKGLLLRAQTIDFEDTFLVHVYHVTRSRIFRFDINGIETKLPLIKVILDGVRNFAPVPSDIAGCGKDRI